MLGLRATEVKPVRGHSRNLCMKTWTKINQETTLLKKNHLQSRLKLSKMIKSTWWNLISWRKNLKILSSTNKMMTRPTNFTKESGARKNKPGKVWRKKEKKRKRGRRKRGKKRNKESFNRKGRKRRTEKNLLSWRKTNLSRNRNPLRSVPDQKNR